MVMPEIYIGQSMYYGVQNVKKSNTNNMKTFLTADLHLFDEDIAKWRGFKDIKSYHETLMINWDKLVDYNDNVYILGDLSKSQDVQAVKFLNTWFNGYKILVPGNHDSMKLLNEFQKYHKHDIQFYPMMQSCANGTIHSYILSHIPLHPNEMDFYNANIHGHIHAPIPEIGYQPSEYPHPSDPNENGHAYYYNVNVEFQGFKPVDFDDIDRLIRLMPNKQ